MANDFQKDLSAVQKTAAVPTILDVVCRATGMEFAAVVRVTDDRWIACQVLDIIQVGLPTGGELQIETTLCNEICQHRQIIAIDNVAEDAMYCDHHTPKTYWLQSYISVPIVLPDGQFFGTLCAIDPKPHAVNNPQIIGTFTHFAELIAHHLDAEDRIANAETTSVLREQFIAVLGHDLRNPLAGLDGGRRMLENIHEVAKSVRILRLMDEGVKRMSGLIDNLMDFARGRMGGDIGVELTSQGIEPLLAQVVNKIKPGHPDQTIEMQFDLSEAVDVDHARIAQMFPNLMGKVRNRAGAWRPYRRSVRRKRDTLHFQDASSF